MNDPHFPLALLGNVPGHSRNVLDLDGFFSLGLFLKSRNFMDQNMTIVEALNGVELFWTCVFGWEWFNCCVHLIEKVKGYGVLSPITFYVTTLKSSSMTGSTL